MRVHFVKGRNGDIAYFCDTLEIKKVTEAEKRQLAAQITEPVYEPMEAVDETYLSTLILHVSNACNMRCRYCFANHGNYGAESGLMPVQVALDAVELFYQRYDRIKQIKFFGGEPMMNPDAIEAVCRDIQGRYDRGEIQTLPEYKIVTNGTILPERAMRLIRDHDIQTVFSMDGPEPVHDYARVFAGDRGSFAVVRDHFRALREYTDGKQPCGVEMTYHAIHKAHGLSMSDVTDYFVREFGVEARTVNISPVSADDGSEFSLKDGNRCLVESARQILDSFYEGKTDVPVDQKLYFLTRKIRRGIQADRQVCNAAWKWVAVSAAGDVYPCFMFMNRDEFKMGNIYADLFSDPRYQRLTERWKSFDRLEKETCGRCFCNRICVNCMGQNMDSSGSVYDKTPEQCRTTRMLMDTVIEGIAEGFF